jgi:hypothetical protein
VVTATRGRVSLGCLIALLLLTVALYFGVNVGEVYWRYLRFKDAMAQEVRFAELRTDPVIARRLASTADSLGLPVAAHHVIVQRDANARYISIGAEYAEQVELPGFVRILHFAPRAEGKY